MSKIEKRVVYYNIKQALVLSGKTSVPLFSDRERKNIVGQAVYINTTFENKITNKKFTKEAGTFFFDQGDCISFEDNSNTLDGILPAGNFTYSIICGQGKYLGATGTINFKVTELGLRIITITAKLA
jgi:hypothetical protein